MYIYLYDAFLYYFCNHCIVCSVVNMDIFDGVIEKVLVFRSNTDEVRLVR